MEVAATGSRDGKPFQAANFFLTSLRTTPEALMKLGLERSSKWFAAARSYEGWHWIRDTQLHEDVHRYRGNGAGAMAMLRIEVLILLRLECFQSIRAGRQAVIHDITELLLMMRR